LESLSAEGFAARLRWHLRARWTPVVGLEFTTGVGEQEEELRALIDVLDAHMAKCGEAAALTMRDADGHQLSDLKPPPQVLQGNLKRLVDVSGVEQRWSVDWAAAFASDVVQDNKGNTKPTALHFTAGQQQWLSMVHSLLHGVTTEDLREALVGPWGYLRELPVMGWDSTASRDYALRASDPSKDKKTGVPGADWLATRGLAFFPVSPRSVVRGGERTTELQTTGCTGGWKTGKFTWPVWTVPLSRQMARTVVRLEGLAELSEAQRIARGIGAVFQCKIRRTDQGGYGSFTPSAPV
jgi:hypothetical protein